MFLLLQWKINRLFRWKFESIYDSEAIFLAQVNPKILQAQQLNVTACKSGKSGTEERGHSLGRPRTDNGNDSSNTQIFPPLKCTVVFLLATPPALTPLSTYSATHARQNTVIHRAEAWRRGGGGERAEKPCWKNYSLGKKAVSTSVCFLKTFSLHFWIRPCPLWKKPELLPNRSVRNSV